MRCMLKQNLYAIPLPYLGIDFHVNNNNVIIINDYVLYVIMKSYLNIFKIVLGSIPSY